MPDLPPGRELDALIAEKVMGCRVLYRNNAPCCGCPRVERWPHGDPEGDYDACASEWLCEYSTDIAAAFEVLERLKTQYPQFCLQWWTSDGVEQSRGSWGFFPVEHTECEALAHAKTAPHAICLAALKATQ